MNSKLIEKEKTAFCKEYKTLSTFLSEQVERGANMNVFTSFSFIKMEKAFWTKEYGILLNYFIANWEGGFTQSEQFALQQMLKITNLPNLLTSSACV